MADMRHGWQAIQQVMNTDRKLSVSTISGRLRLMKVGEMQEFSPMTNEITLRNNCSRLKKDGDGEWCVFKQLEECMVKSYQVVRLR